MTFQLVKLSCVYGILDQPRNSSSSCYFADQLYRDNEAKCLMVYQQQESELQFNSSTRNELCIS